MKSSVFFFSIVLAAGIFMAGCGKPDVPTAVTAPTPSVLLPDFTPGSVGLRAFPNPVPITNGIGKTAISWQTGTGETGEVYLVDPASERLFARGPSGSSDAPWIGPGTTRFRLYRGTDHREALADLTVATVESPFLRSSASPAGDSSQTPTPSAPH